MENYEDLDSFPVGQLLAAMVLLATIRALWVRRSTWRIPWEIASTLNVSLQFAEIFLISGPVARWLGPKLHAATGLWNMEDLTGHLCYMIAMTYMTYMALSRLDISDERLARYVRRRIELPMLLFVPTVVALFMFGGMDSHPFDLVLSHPTPWLRIYFMMYVAGALYLLTMAVPALLIIRRDPRQKHTATAYLCATTVTVVTCATMVVGIPILTWVLIRVETASYAVAASYSWGVRRRLLRGPCLLPSC